MDWLNKARQFLGNLIGGASKTIGNIAGGVARNVSRAEQEASRFAQQAARNVPRMQIPQAPRFQLPQINIQAPRIQMPQAPRIQAPKIDFGAVSRALQGIEQQTGRGIQDWYNKTAISKIAPGIQSGLQDMQKQSDLIKQRQIQSNKDFINQFKTSPATAIFQTPGLSPFGGISQAFKTAKIATGKELPKFDTTKAVEDLSQTLSRTPLRKVPGMGVVGDIVKPLTMSAARMADVAQTQEEYDKGIKGLGQMGSDIFNIASLFYSGSLSKQLAAKGTPFLKTAAKLAPRLALSGAGTNILQQLAEGKKPNELDPKQIAIAAAAYTTLGIGIPGATRGVSTGLNKALSKSQSGLASKVAQGLPGIPGAKAAQAGPIPRPIAENVYPIQPGVGRIKPPAGSVVDATPGLSIRAQQQFANAKIPSGEIATSGLSSPFLLKDLNYQPGLKRYQPNIQKYILNADGNPIGGINGFYEGPNRAILSNVYVLPGERGKGAASKLIKSFEQEARINGVSEIKITSKADKLYEKLGYKIDPNYQSSSLKTNYIKTIQKPRPELPMQPKAPKGQEALFAEARKYKSADEFVKAQGTSVYHGGRNKIDKFEPYNIYIGTDATGKKISSINGVYFTNSQSEAGKFGKNISEGIISSNAKIKKVNLKTTDARIAVLQSSEYKKKILREIKLAKKEGFDALEIKRSSPTKGTNIEVQQMQKQLNKMRVNFEKAMSKVNDEIFSKNPTKETIGNLYKNAESKYPIISKYKKLYAELNPTHTIIFNSDKIKTKSQLTDIWNQANKPTLPVKPIFETVPESAMRPKAPKGVESIPPGRRERGFISTVKESPQTEATTLTLLKQSDGTYKVKPNRILEKQANERIASNVADAKTYAITQTDDQAIATATQLIKYFQAKGDYGQAAEVASQAARTLTDAGRTIQAATLYNKLNPDGILQYASSKMQKVGKKLDPQSAEILTNMAKKIEAMPDGEPKQIAIKELLDEVGRTQGSALPDKIITLWKAGLLTSPITTAGNLTSNTIKQVVKKTADDPIAAIVDMTLGLATGKRTKTFTLRGEVSGAEEGLKRGIKYFKTGYDPRDPISKLDQKDVYFSKGFFGKAAKGYTDTVFRSLGAQDQPYFYAALKNTLYDQAIAAAKNKGIKGASREQFIKNFINNPDTKILDQATEEARTAVFQNKTLLGDIASRITQSNNPTVRTIGQFIMPFSRVPSAVATEIFERTPLGAAKEIVKQIAKKSYDQRALSTAISKSTTGTLGLMGLGYALDRGGNINLAMPTSQAEQNLWQQEGRQPFSIKIGDKYYSMNYIQPFGSLIAMGAQYNRSLRENGKQQDALAAAFAMGAKAVTEQSFLRGVSGALGALQDPTRYAERFVEQTAGSIIPNAIRTTARAFDPLQREVGTAGEAIIAGIPGLRQTLQPKVDIFGQPIARTANPIDTLFNPLRPTTAKSTPETQEIRRLFDVNKNIIPSEIDKNVFGKENPINQQQINNLKTTMGNAVLNRYQQIMSDPRYVQLSDDQKAKALKDAKDAVIQGEKFKFAIANNLPYTTADKLDKDTADYLNGIIKDTIAATLPKPPKVKVSKARRGRTSRRGGGRRGGGTARIRISKAPRISRISIKTPKISASKISKGKKLSFKVPKPKATARKSIKIKTG
jgi:N-acetylglutamate synthase-like GNAT family acetyltransferase